MADLKISALHKSYGAMHAVRGIDLEIPAGEFTALVGQSGCGKSTLLRCIAGLEDIDAGQIAIGGALVNDLEPSARDIAMVFQNYALYPHMTVYANMAYGLKIAKVPEAEIKARVDKAAKILELGPFLQRKPRELSGGQRQRVAMGRAIVRNARLYLFDEPLSNLDAQLRDEMRGEIKRLHQQPVAQGHRLDLVMRHIQAGHRHAPLQPLDLGAHGHPQLGVEVGQRLVEQEHLRLAHDGTTHRHALALPA